MCVCAIIKCDDLSHLSRTKEQKTGRGTVKNTQLPVSGEKLGALEGQRDMVEWQQN